MGDFSRRLVWRLNVLLIVAVIGLATSPKLISYTAINLHPADKNLFVVVAGSGFAVGFVFARMRLFASLDTWLHEYAHAVTAASLGGKPSKIRLAKDMSGLTNFTFKSNWRFRSVLVSAAGPLASMVTFVVATRMALAGTSRFFLLMVCIVIVSVLITTVRSGFGWFVGILAALATGLCVALDGGHIPLIHTTNSSLILLAASVSSAAGVGMREAIRRFKWDSPDGDEGKIAMALHVPEKLVDFAMTCLHIAGLWLIYNAVNDLAIDWVQLGKSLDLATIWKSITDWLHQVAPTIFAGN